MPHHQYPRIISEWSCEVYSPQQGVTKRRLLRKGMKYATRFKNDQDKLVIQCYFTDQLHAKFGKDETIRMINDRLNDQDANNTKFEDFTNQINELHEKLDSEKERMIDLTGMLENANDKCNNAIKDALKRHERDLENQRRLNESFEKLQDENSVLAKKNDDYSRDISNSNKNCEDRLDTLQDEIDEETRSLKLDYETTADEAVNKIRILEAQVEKYQSNTTNSMAISKKKRQLEDAVREFGNILSTVENKWIEDAKILEASTKTAIEDAKMLKASTKMAIGWTQVLPVMREKMNILIDQPPNGMIQMADMEEEDGDTEVVLVGNIPRY